jgi:hypothetical protein
MECGFLAPGDPIFTLAQVVVEYGLKRIFTSIMNLSGASDYQCGSNKNWDARFKESPAFLLTAFLRYMISG